MALFIKYFSTHNNTNHDKHSKDSYLFLLLVNITVLVFFLFVFLCYFIASLQKPEDPFVEATDEEIQDIQQCPICLNDLEEDNNLRFKVCTHILCVQCGEELVRNNINRCPICRRNIYDINLQQV